MKRGVAFLFVFLMLFSAGAFAETISEGSVTGEVANYVKDFVGKQGIADDEVNEVRQLNQTELPKDIKIQKIDKNKVGIYEVNYTKENKNQKVFVVTYSTTQFEKENEVKNIQNLQFGYSGIANGSLFLDSATGVAIDGQRGYVMMRAGSITGISTSMEMSGSGSVEIKVYKNGVDTGFSNFVNSDDVKKIDYDLQSEDIINYQAGDVISVYVEQNDDVAWGNVVTMVETTS